ncbi:type II toxin-antitoxin system MqsA family antitoxin [Candidatus Spongiihabitans sp.]|uniref:type II toxin-antitoxin system MqsA family antitoxin n=1 Tax=Candidatus Spongiihabitans sp. TaxID=3101308 RepID=UPI003C704614
MKLLTDECPVCWQGKLTASTFTGKFKPRDGSKPFQVKGLECCLCDSCGCAPVLTDQIKRNEIKIADTKRKRIGLLTSAEIKAIRIKLNLTQKRAAEIFGGGANAFSKYERGYAIQSEAMDKLIRVAAKLPDAYSMLAEGNKTVGKSQDTFTQPLDAPIVENTDYHISQSMQDSAQMPSIKPTNLSPVNAEFRQAA